MIQTAGSWVSSEYGKLSAFYSSGQAKQRVDRFCLEGQGSVQEIALSRVRVNDCPVSYLKEFLRDVKWIDEDCSFAVDLRGNVCFQKSGFKTISVKINLDNMFFLNMTVPFKMEVAKFKKLISKELKNSFGSNISDLWTNPNNFLVKNDEGLTLDQDKTLKDLGLDETKITTLTLHLSDKEDSISSSVAKIRERSPYQEHSFSGLSLPDIPGLVSAPEAGKNATVSAKHYDYQTLTVGKSKSKEKSYLKEIKAFREQLIRQIELVGEENLDIAARYNQLGFALFKVGQIKEGLGLCQKAFALEIELDAGEDPIFPATCCNIGLIFSALGKHTEGLDFLERALEKWIALHGQIHVDVARAYNNIGMILNNMGRPEDALRYCKLALELQNQLELSDRTHIAASYNNIGMILCTQGNAQEGLRNLHQSLEIRQELYGEQLHPDLAVSYNNIGLAYFKLKNWKKSLQQFQKAAQIQKEFYGKTHPDLATTYINMGSVWEMQKNYKEAIWCYGDALVIRTEIYGKKHLSRAEVFSSLGLAYYKWWTEENDKQYLLDNAIDDHRKAIAELAQCYGTQNHPSIALVYGNMGGILRRSKHFDKALECYQRIGGILKALYGEKHSSIQKNEKIVSTIQEYLKTINP